MSNHIFLDSDENPFVKSAALNAGSSKKYRVEYQVYEVDEEGNKKEIGFGTSDDNEKFSECSHEIGSQLDNYEWETELDDSEADASLRRIMSSGQAGKGERDD